MGRAESVFIWRSCVVSESIKHCAKHITQEPGYQLASSLSHLTSQTNSKETGEEAEIYNSASSAAGSVFISYCRALKRIIIIIHG